ncbi:hypothetical protein QCA50_003152 [Cerrena zonata]|uniref:Uncharacterized protein n=1 Tax=Cerrena zonata TaxID=2478898 RepID=A0AAW0GIV2_9APHY
MTVLPMVAYAALKFGEAGMDVMKSLRPLIVALVPGQQKSLDRVKAMRERLSHELEMRSTSLVLNFGMTSIR